MIRIIVRLFFLILLVVHSSYSSAQLFKFQASVSQGSSASTVLVSKPDAGLLVEGNESGVVIFRDINTAAELSQMKFHYAPINTMEFNSTGQLLITSTKDGEIKVYDFDKGKIVNSLFSPDYGGLGFALFSIADGFIYFNGESRLYKIRSDLSGEVEKVMEFPSPISSAVVTEDRSALIMTVGKSLRVLNTRSDVIMQEISTGNADVKRLVLMPGDRVMSWGSDGSINIWKFQYGQLVTPALAWFKAGMPSNVAFSHDGKWMVSGNIATLARIWEPMKKSVVQELLGHKDDVRTFAFSNDDQTLFTGSKDRTIRIWKQKLDSVPPLEVAKPIVQVEPEKKPEPEKKIEPEKKAVVAEKKPEPVAPPVKTPEPAPLAVQPSDELPKPVFGEKNIPTSIDSRTVKKMDDIVVHDPTVEILVYDNMKIDGDTLSINFNGEWILRHYPVLREKKPITLQLLENTNNYLVLYADNLGVSPPNTAVIEFKTTKVRRTVRLDSDLKSCVALNFIYKK